MRHKYNLLSSGVPDGDLPFLFAGMLGIRKSQCQWVKEDSRRLIKRHAMLLNISFCLRRGPLIDHRFQSIAKDSSGLGPRLPSVPGMSQI